MIMIIFYILEDYIKFKVVKMLKKKKNVYYVWLPSIRVIVLFMFELVSVVHYLSDCDIDHQRCHMHQSQKKTCTRCRYIGHGIDDTGLCEAFSSDQNIITIRSPKNVLCNYYMCDIDMYGHTFHSSEQAYQWKFTNYVGRHDLGE